MVDAGKYLVRGILLNPNYVQQWYNGVYNMEKGYATCCNRYDNLGS